MDIGMNSSQIYLFVYIGLWYIKNSKSKNELISM